MLRADGAEQIKVGDWIRRLKVHGKELLLASTPNLAAVFHEGSKLTPFYSQFDETAPGPYAKRTEVGILFTPMEPEDFVSFFDSVSRAGFAMEQADRIFTDALAKRTASFVRKVAKANADPTVKGSKTFLEMVAHESEQEGKWPGLLAVLANENLYSKKGRLHKTARLAKKLQPLVNERAKGLVNQKVSTDI